MANLKRMRFIFVMVVISKIEIGKTDIISTNEDAKLATVTHNADTTDETETEEETAEYDIREEAKKHGFQLEQLNLDLQPALCPKMCKCTKLTTSKILANCSHLKMEKIHNACSKVTVKLLLNNNIIVDVPEFVFENMSSLVYLDLSTNSIKRLQNNSLFGLPNLTYLSLANNKLVHVDSFPKNVFTVLLRIQTLHLQRNCDSGAVTGCRYHDHAIGGAPNIRVLYMDGIPKTDLGPGFRVLTKLKEIRMNNNVGFCRLNILNGTTFFNLKSTSLQVLDLTDCHIHTISPYAFSSLTFLTTLIMSENCQLCAIGLNNLVIGLNETRIDKLILKHTCDTFPLRLDASFSLPLNQTSLRHLDLEHSHVQFVSPSLVTGLPKTVEFVSLRNNEINDGHFGSQLWTMSGLKYLDGSYQNHYVFTANHRGKGTSEETTMEVKNKLEIKYRLPLNLQYANLSFLKIPEFPDIAITFDLNNSLEILDVSNNMITDFVSKCTGLHHLKYLNMSHNRVRYIHHDVFGDFPELRVLKLCDNKLDFMEFNATFARIFRNLTKLEYLDLSANNIKQLPLKIFDTLGNLKELYLSYNSLNKVTFKLDGLTSLEVLDLSNNQILVLSSTTLKELDTIRQRHSLQLSLHGNYLACTCEQRHFVNWLLNTNVNIKNKEATSCKFINETEVNITGTSLRQIRLILDIECISWVVLTGCIVGFISLLTILSFVAALYSQRWKLRYLYYTGRRNINPYRPIEDAEIAPRLDAYLSLDEGHVLHNGHSLYDFVSKKLYTELQRRGLNIKIRQELCSGRLMHDVISSAIKQSKKVVVFLSAEYCHDFWSSFEFNMAAYEGIYNKRNMIIQVFVGSIRSGDLQPEIEAYTTNQPGLAFPTDENFDAFVDALVREIMY